MAADWSSVEAEFGQIVAESDPPFSAETIAHAGDFLNYLRHKTAAPTIARGYWPTLAVWWEYSAGTEPATTTQFEVFAQKIEIMWFEGMHVKGIEDIAHLAGDPIPPEIEAALPK